MSTLCSRLQEAALVGQEAEEGLDFREAEVLVFRVAPTVVTETARTPQGLPQSQPTRVETQCG
jgi:hypothetical protein